MTGTLVATHPHPHRSFYLSLAALGVVYGDIGTSPLYAFRESLHGLPVNIENVLGVLSLIFWSLILVISIKYLMLILRADNDGEGGILALLALLKRRNGTIYKFSFFIGILGAGLLLGDAMLTPAISVLSAIEGLKVISPGFSHFVIPITVILLLGLFFFQSYGTAKIGSMFGPLLFIWFITIGILGLVRILQNPKVILAINPYYGFLFFYHNGWAGYALLGGVFLVVTGGEALYADLGHFGRAPIRLSWFAIVLPGLLLNYFGQGAYLLQFPSAITNPFYSIAPPWFSFPLLILATCATTIASQAVISATFSLTKQAILLDLYPRITIVQTSDQEKGQIFVPQMNMILTVGTLILVFAFKNSSALSHAYGIAVNLDMFIVSLLVTRVAYLYWQWPIIKIISIFSIFILIDVAFLGANIQKIVSGGWVPLVFAAICAFVMITWKNGIEYLRSSYYMEKTDLSEFVDQLDLSEINHVPRSTAIFVTDPYDNSGGSLLHYLKLNHILPEYVLIVSIAVKSHPYIIQTERYDLKKLSNNIYRLILYYGFMDEIDIPSDLTTANSMKVFPFHLNVEKASYLIEIPCVIATTRKSTLLFFWQEKFFAFLMRNAALDIEFYKLPYNRTIAIGAYCEI